MMCEDPKRQYDANSNLAGILFISMAGIYVILVVYMFFRLVHTLVRDPRARNNHYNTAFFLFVLMELIIRIVYFPGSVKPLCYDVQIYIILSDYPCLAQSISMVMLICRYFETLGLIQHERKGRFDCFKSTALVFAMIYTILYAASHTYGLLYTSTDNPNLTINYTFACAGQTLILVVFTLTSMYLMHQMQEVCASLTSSTMKNVLIAFSGLLALRIVLAVLNICGVTGSLRTNGQVYILLTFFYPTFEAAPAILLLIFSFLQEQQRTDMSKKRVDVKEIIKNSSIKSADELKAKNRAVDPLLAYNSPSKHSEEDD